MSLSENWNFLVGGGSPAITAAFGMVTGGLAPNNQILTAQVWSGGSPLRFGLPLRFVARDNAMHEVLDPIRYLMRMALPVSEGLFLRPPGPSINSKLAGYGVRDGSDQIILWVGNYIRIPEIFIEAVEVTFKGKLNKQGQPMEASISLRCSTLYAPVAQNIPEWIGMGMGRQEAQERNYRETTRGPR